MPFPALLRRNRKSELNIRRHSIVVDDRQTSAQAADLGLASALTGRPSECDEGVNGPRDDETRSSISIALAPKGDYLAPPGDARRSRAFPGLARFRNASDSQLSARAKDDTANVANASDATVTRPSTSSPSAPFAGSSDLVPWPIAPAIIKTSPTFDPATSQTTQQGASSGAIAGQACPGSRRAAELDSASVKRIAFDRAAAQERPRHSRGQTIVPGERSTASPGAPPAYGDDANSSLALPVSRRSESSRSDGSSSERVAYRTTTTTQTVSTTTTIFRLPRRRKRSSFFSPPATPGESASQPKLEAVPPVPSLMDGVHQGSPQQGAGGGDGLGAGVVLAPPSPSKMGSGEPKKDPIRRQSQILRHESTHSARSTKSSPTLVPPGRLGSRDRSSTMASLNDEMRRSTPSLLSGRTSTATTGRSSLGGMFSLSSRFRPSFDSPFPRHGSPATPSSNTSKPNSLSLARESVVIPERETDEAPAKYLGRLQQAVNSGAVAGILARTDDAFSQTVLRSYMRSFAFFEDPMDMAIRKLLMKVELPKETQHIDRVLQRFADRYHECNPGIFSSPDQAYFIAFSLLILQTDAFNKNNKHKMQKHDYIKNTHEYGEGVSEDILACFYDNICYTPFIHVEDDLDVNSGRALVSKGRKSMFARSGSDLPKKTPKEPLDPYTLIIENGLDFLRPNLKEVMSHQDPYSYLGTAKSFDLHNLQRTFFRYGVLQIVSARSRPDAFTSPVTISNPEDAHPGVVGIKITKIGVLWRKDAKRKKTRSPWQEWGAILTGSQLYFFRNVTWIKNLLHQYDSHQRTNRTATPVLFKPPLENFKPDALMSTDDAVALLDSGYKKHKNAFIFVRHGGFEEILLAESESEMNDWLAKLNYAAAFRSTGVRMRAMVGRSATVSKAAAAATKRTNTNNSHASTLKTAEDALIMDGIDGNVPPEIVLARRQIMCQRIRETNEKLTLAQKQLDHQLRNARHLQILAPIQAKTREHTILAAGRMAAKLKWIRMEIWRGRCHRDILLLDLQDEGVPLAEIEAAMQQSPDATPALDAKQGLSSAPALSAEGSSRQMPQSAQPVSRQSPREGASGVADAPKTPRCPAPPSLGLPVTNPVQDPQHAPCSRPVSRAEQTYSAAESRPASSLGQAQVGSSAVSAQGSPSSTAKHGAKRPSVEDAEAELLKRAGLRGSDLVPRPDDPMDATNHPLSDGEGNDKSKVRRSLHRSLREGHVGAHHRHKKARDSSSSAVLGEDGTATTETEGLARGAGSFTLHGKKASVVTFGSEWQTIPPEDRLRQRKQAHDEDAKAESSGALLPTASILTTSPPRLTSAGQGSTRSIGTTATASTLSTNMREELAIDFGDVDWGDLNVFASLSDESQRQPPAPALAESPTQDSYVSYRSSRLESTNIRHSAAVTTDEEYQSAPEDSRESEKS